VDSCQDDPQYKVMKYLVFGTILSSLLSELQIIIPKTDLLLCREIKGQAGEWR
jgi:hypothetical protein